MFRKRQKTSDERIQKRTNELSAKMFPFIWVASAVFLFVKAVCGLPVIVYGLEILALVLGSAVWLIEEMRSGTLFTKEKDNVLKELSAKAKMEAFYTMFWIFIIGELLYIFFVDKKYFFWVITYFAIWVPPCLVFTIIAISEGLLAFGTRKKEKEIKKSLGFRTFIGAIVFGIIIGMLMCFIGGTFNPKRLVMIPLLAAGWGIPFYFLMTLMMKISEKCADKKMKESGNSDEE